MLGRTPRLVELARRSRQLLRRAPDAQLQELLADEPPEIQAEILRINTDARNIALQVALIVPLVAALLGLGVSIRMMRQPDPEPSGAGEMVLGG